MRDYCEYCGEALTERWEAGELEIYCSVCCWDLDDTFDQDELYEHDAA